jgi:fructose-1,6-bisphosphatase/inositol monophosphatase family enzyme
MRNFGESESEPRIEDEHKRVAKIALDALTATRALHDQLGSSGEEVVQKNQFGETALRIDIESERVIIQSFRDAGIPIRIISEEHGVTEISENPVFLAVLDGLDGTKTYREQRGKGRYGTMLGVFSSNHPTYGDYVFGGVAEHGLDRLIYATKNIGAFIRQHDEERQIHTSGMLDLGKQTRFGIDEYFEFNRNLYLPLLTDAQQIREFSAESRYVDVATGDADLGLESSRKGNLEIASAYGIIHEAGGVIVDEQGQDIGSQAYEEFGQDSQIPIITAATPELAEQLILRLRQRHK